MITWISWLATLLTLTSVILLAYNRKFGWIVGGVGSVVWITYASITNQPALLVVNTVFIGVDWLG